MEELTMFSKLHRAVLAFASLTSPVFVNSQSEAAELPESAKEVAQSTNEFAFDLYKHLSRGGNNLFFSPASISA